MTSDATRRLGNRLVGAEIRPSDTRRDRQDLLRGGPSPPSAYHPGSIEGGLPTPEVFSGSGLPSRCNESMYFPTFGHLGRGGSRVRRK